jgi:hypothetical protein
MVLWCKHSLYQDVLKVIVEVEVVVVLLLFLLLVLLLLLLLLLIVREQEMFAEASCSRTSFYAQLFLASDVAAAAVAMSIEPTRGGNIQGPRVSGLQA